MVASITPEKRYQVFISSTYEDLKKERAEVTQAILELDCIPCGMEAFPAADDTQWKWIQRMIEGCDYYIVIIGGKCGSINADSNLSYTRMEYEYAIEKRIPTLAFIIEDSNTLLANQIDIDPEKIQKLEDFKNLVKSKLCKFYANADDLGSKVSRSLVQAIRQYPRTGWVRANSLDNYTANSEVIKLMKENEDLKSKKSTVDNLKKGDDLISLKVLLKDQDFWGKSISDRNISLDIDLSINEIFFLFADVLSDSMSPKRDIDGLQYILTNYILVKSINNNIPADINLEDIALVFDRKEVKLILQQLEVLNLLSYSSSYWELSKTGRKKYILENALRKEKQED